MIEICIKRTLTVNDDGVISQDAVRTLTVFPAGFECVYAGNPAVAVG